MMKLWKCLILLTVACAAMAHAENIIFPPDSDLVIDVTKEPYNCDNSGRKDCTKALQKAFDDLLRPDYESTHDTLAFLNDPANESRIYITRVTPIEKIQAVRKKDPKALVGEEICSGIFPRRFPLNKILYFPEGTYLVNDTIVYSYKDLINVKGKELNRCIRFRGQNEGNTIIKLADNSPNFKAGQEKPVVSFTRGNFSNVAMQNAFENLTIDIGQGNPGAIGLEFFANNSGALRHVTIRSSDPKKSGFAGLSMIAPNNSCSLVQHVTISGFDYGIRMTHPRLNTVFEHIHLSGQRVCGFELQNHNVSLRGLESINTVPALRISGTATLALVDSVLSNPAGQADVPAIDLLGGDLFANNVQCKDYDIAVKRPDVAALKTDELKQYVSRRGPSPFGAAQETLNLPVEETPHVEWEQDLSQWASVHDYGAVGDGFADDTDAIQRAMDSGKPVIYFKTRQYLINRAITIPATVKRVNFMYGDLIAGPQMRNDPPRGALQVIGESSDPLLLEDLFAFELFFGDQYLIDHAGKRTLIVSDVHVQIAALYYNTVSGGKVFFDNIASAVKSVQGKAVRKNNCSFFGQKVWARQFNIERGSPECLNDGSTLWVLGFKTEQDGSSFETINGGQTEILGGIFNNTRSDKSVPDIIIKDSSVSVFACTTGSIRNTPQNNARALVRETQNGVTKETALKDFPVRNQEAGLVTVPLYRSADKGSQK